MYRPGASVNSRTAAAMAMQSTADPSYPSIYRQPNPDPVSDRPPPPMSPPDDHAEIPVMDLQDLDPGLLGEACREWGVFRLSNHGIPPALSAQLVDQARGILSLPFESKQAQFSHPILYFWGTPVITQPVQNLHWFDGLQVPLGGLQSDGVGGDPDSGSCSSSFRCLVDEYGKHMARIARALFDALVVYLKLDSGQSASYLCESDGIFRVYRYLRCPDASNHFGFHAHTDSSTLSILNQDEVGGLQVLHGNRWLDVAPIPDMLIVNLGDMMQAISNDECKSVEHRVLVSSSKERISLCYFAFPSDDSVIINSKYKAFTYKDFRSKVQEDVKALGYKVGLERFKISDLGC